MSIPDPLTPAGRTATDGGLEALAHPGEAPLADALLELITRLDLPFAVKDAASGH